MPKPLMNWMLRFKALSNAASNSLMVSAFKACILPGLLMVIVIIPFSIFVNRFFIVLLKIPFHFYLLLNILHDDSNIGARWKQFSYAHFKQFQPVIFGDNPAAGQQYIIHFILFH